MQPQPRKRSQPKTKKRPARSGPRKHAGEVPIPDIDEAETTDLADDPVYIHADRVHHLEPGSVTEEDTEHAEAEITELFRRTDPL